MTVQTVTVQAVTVQAVTVQAVVRAVCALQSSSARQRLPAMLLPGCFCVAYFIVVSA